MKRTFAFILTLMLLVPTVMSFIFAGAPAIEPARWEPCPECDGPMHFSTEYSSWVTTGFQLCPKNPNYNDQVQKRNVYQMMTCARCGYGYTTTTIETKVNCTH